MSVLATMDRNKYGATETNGLMNGDGYHDFVKYDETLTLGEVAERGGVITRVRLLTEYVPVQKVRYADVSYIHATLPDGSVHPVRNGADVTYYHTIKGDFIAWAKRENVFAKNIGLLDEGNWSVVR